jgi:hypothetical protein
MPAVFKQHSGVSSLQRLLAGFSRYWFLEYNVSAWYRAIERRNGNNRRLLLSG